MLSKLESFVNKYLVEQPADSTETERQLMISTAVIFLEMAYADFEISPEEEGRLREILKALFALDDDELTGLLEAARESRAQRQDIWMFTNTLKNHFDHDQKMRILENLWRVVFADGRVDRYEDALIRKITSLLGLEHGDMIQTKLKVKNEG